MFLQDFDFSHLKKIKKINYFLKENYGFTLDVNATKDNLLKMKKE